MVHFFYKYFLTQMDEDTEPVYTLGDILIASNLLDEAEYQGSKKWGDEDTCMYDQGPTIMNVYSCLTCKKEEDGHVGVCFGCSMSCHLEHEIVELFEKRDFRCDCPTTSKCKCTLHLPVSTGNETNTYNHNFDGLFCWCNKEYNSDQVMIQCFACFDWYHDHCIKEEYKAVIPCDDDDESEYVCRTCMKKFEFLKMYPYLLYDAKESSKPLDSDICLLKSTTSTIPGDAFFKKGWVVQLCQCNDCKTNYLKTGFDKLMSHETQEDIDIGEAEDLKLDTNVKKRNSEDENETPEAKRLKISPYQQQLLALGYNHLATQFKEFLTSFSESGKVITEDDVNNFFRSIRE